MTPLLSTTGLQKKYGSRLVVKGVDIEVGHEEIVGLLGPNGAGKTTSFYMIAGLVAPSQGSVFFDGENITRVPMHKRAQVGMGYLPQEESIFRQLTVEENLMAVLEFQKNLSRKEQQKKADELLDKFSITRLRKSKAIALSGGEKRRLSIARCLATDPKLLMLDEPFSGVDPIAVKEIQMIVKELRETEGLSILITDHNVRETLQIVDKAYILQDGEVILKGSMEELINDPVAKQAYLGEDFSM